MGETPPPPPNLMVAQTTDAVAATAITLTGSQLFPPSRIPILRPSSAATSTRVAIAPQATPAVATTLPPPLDEALSRALSKNPAGRFPRCEDSLTHSREASAVLTRSSPF